MDSLSTHILTILLPFSVLFSKPSWKKVLTLVLGALICTKKRTVCAALHAMGLEHIAGFAKYHHLLNRTQWSLLKAAKILFLMLLVFVPEGCPIVLFVDETLERRRGKKIKAKGYYRDAVRSSKYQIVKTSGLKWLSMTISLKLPIISRTLALPFLTVLEPSKKCNEKQKRRHKTTLRWTSQMIFQVRRWIGKAHQMILVGDGGFAAGQLAIDCICAGIALVSRLKMNASLFDFPSKKANGTRGRPPRKGQKLKNFKQMLFLEKLPWRTIEIMSYGGITRTVRFVSSTCMWGADGVIPVPIRWVLVTDPTDKLDPLPLMSTDSSLSPEQMIALYIDRWSIEVMFEEVREHLGVETQRQWSDKAIARTTPILLGLYSLVCLMANRLSQEKPLKAEGTAWYHKEHVTFSDMLRAVRLLAWRENFIYRKAKLMPSFENITSEMEEWMQNVVKCILQAA